MSFFDTDRHLAAEVQASALGHSELSARPNPRVGGDKGPQDQRSP